MGAEHSQISETATLTRRNSISFSINGKIYNVDASEHNIGPTMMLVDFIRNNAFLKGTKYMCREGGCGACVVSVKTRNNHTGEEVIRGINSCLAPVYACDGWEITTVEQLGNKKSGYHPIQQRLAQFHGTQCGFCTPGWVMNMYSLMQSKRKVTATDIEDNTDANICRCTGYRPILDAMKSMAVDVSEELKRKCQDLDACKGCPQNPNKCQERINSNCDAIEDFVRCEIPLPIHMNLKSGEQWIKAVDMTTLFMAINEFQAKGLKFKIVAGNTGTGVYKYEGPYQAFVELKSIYTLGKIEMNSERFVVGGTVTISSAIDAMNKASSMEGYEYCKILTTHWKRVANVSVRNAGTLAGNLMIKHNHKEFPSDIFLTLETIGAMLTISSSVSMQEMHSLKEFLELDMTGKIIYSIHFPKLSGFYLRTFKITRRYQSSHAYVNAGFLMKVTPDTFILKEKPTIVFGGISSNFVHASMTEEFLAGKTLDPATIQGAMETLEREVDPETMPAEAHPKYRKSLTQSLLYKVILDILGDKVSERMKSGISSIERGLRYGKQVFDSDKTEWPLREPVQKLEAPFQCSGEAEYINDKSPACEELQGIIVLTKVGNATLKNVDASEALKMTGVTAWVDYKNIPGENNYMARSGRPFEDAIFVRDKVRYAGEPIGVIVAESREIGMQAAKLVTVTYEDVEKPVLDIPTALEAVKKLGRLKECFEEAIQSKLEPSPQNPIPSFGATHNLKGEFKSGTQHHFHMETHVCICIPKEGILEVHSTTQDIYQVHNAITAALAIPANCVNIYVLRLGGGFGGKLARSAHLASVCAVTANAVNRPVRMVMDIETNLSMIGKRCGYLSKYDVGFDDEGKILNLDIQLLCDGGCCTNEATTKQALQGLQNVYAANSWKVQPVKLTTNTAPNTFCRSPGVPHTIACMETIMEHIAFHLKKNPLDVKKANFLKEGDPIFVNPNHDQVFLTTENYILKLLEVMKTSADLEDREKFIAKFNNTNRWKKRGLALLPMRSPCHYWFTGYYAHISIYAYDGSVAVSHSAIEMGQGVNTKVAQVVARELNIPMDKIKVKRTDNISSPNATFTGVGVTTEKICFAAMKSCAILLERMAPVKEKMENPTWEQLAAKCKQVGINLNSSYSSTYADNLKSYDSWGLTGTEVEIDCLTGEYKVIRVDLLSDVGKSISPAIDIGQVEGAFVMGLGFCLTEKVQYDETTGEMLTNRSWNYKPPMAKDIPEDFRITLLNNIPNELGVLRSKTPAEVALNMAFSAVLAIRAAITSARMDAGNSEWFAMDIPLTPEDIHRLCLTDSTQFSV